MDTTTGTTNTPRAVRAIVAGAALLLTVGLAGCSGADDGTASGASTSSATGIGAKWGSCMRDAGYDVPDPDDALVASGTVVTPQGVDQEQYAEDADHCSSELGVERADSADQDEWTRQYAQVASCIREEYPDFPEQKPGVLGIGPDDYARATEDGFQDRADACLHEYSPDTQIQHAG
jgi:hypothetical protein